MFEIIKEVEKFLLVHTREVNEKIEELEDRILELEKIKTI